MLNCESGQLEQMEKIEYHFSEGNDWNDNIKDELYKREDHFERIFVEKSYKKQKN